jgi:hypothetical protein
LPKIQQPAILLMQSGKFRMMPNEGFAKKLRGRNDMSYRGTRFLFAAAVACLLCPGGAWQARAADAEIDQLLKSPIGKDWVTNGGNLTNQRYSTLKQINTENAGQLKGAWMTRLKGSGVGGK